ncbi:putative LRR containing protein [Trachipleistophora hominis]|uniref:Putative LRR containing protein n=1 Tax=Trachipleistophora hominis TaxID=72359 RepID=L7JT16_TRAHO|nr:putative LRR containing protein [Trachipleistophora hominis]
MFHQLFNHIDRALVTILIFDGYSQKACKDFLVCNVLEETEIGRLMEKISLQSAFYSDKCEAQRSGFKCCTNSEPIEQIEADKLYHDLFLYSFHGIKKLTYKCFHDVIQSNKDVSFKTVTIPFSKFLFVKILNLVPFNANNYMHSEIYMLLRYMLPLKYRTGWLVGVVCAYFNSNQNLINQLKSHNEDPIGYELTFEMAFLSNVLFGKSYTAECFRKAVNSYIVFSLVGMNNSGTCITVKHLNEHNYLIKQINLNEFFIGFLSDRIILSYSYLVHNDSVLDERFNTIASNHSLTVEVYDDETNSGIIIVNGEIFDNIKILMGSKFLIGRNIGKLILNINEPVARLYSLSFSCLSTLTTIRCEFDVIGFLYTIPEHIQIILEVFGEVISNEMLMMPSNVIRLEFYQCEFETNISLPSHLKSVELYASVIANDAIIVFNENIEEITVLINMAGQFDLSGTGGFNRIDGKLNIISPIEYKKQDEILSLRLYCVYVYGIVYIDPSIEIITLNSVTLRENSKIVFSKTNKTIKITNCAGVFDLRENLGVEFHLEENMKIDIAKYSDVIPNVCNITLCNVHFEHNIVLPEDCTSIVLSSVMVPENVLVILNSSCKTICISNSIIALDARNVGVIETISLEFSTLKSDSIRFINSERVNHLHLYKICRNPAMIKSLLTDFKEIHHLQFNNYYVSQETDLFITFLDDSHSLSLFDEVSNDFISFLKKTCASQPCSSSSYLYMRSNVVINYILNAFLNESTAKTMKKLEIKDVFVSVDNCKLFPALCNLEILGVFRMESVMQLLHNLPPNLKILNIAGKFDRTVNQPIQYLIRPSVLVRLHNNMRVLVVDIEFVSNLLYISHLMPALEVLMVRYASLSNTVFRKQNKKIKLRELIVECTDNLIIIGQELLSKPKIYAFVSHLFDYVDFSLLDDFVFISPNKMMKIDPKSISLQHRTLNQQIMSLRQFNY